LTWSLTWLDHGPCLGGQGGGRVVGLVAQLFVTFGLGLPDRHCRDRGVGSGWRSASGPTCAALGASVVADPTWPGTDRSRVCRWTPPASRALEPSVPRWSFADCVRWRHVDFAAGGGPGYDRVAQAISDWLPIAAIIGCAVLVVLPHARPLDIDPTAMGTCLVVLLAVARLRMLQGRERIASQRLTAQISERAAATVSLARLEAAATIEETAGRICAEGRVWLASTRSPCSPSVPPESYRLRSGRNDASRWRS